MSGDVLRHVFTYLVECRERLAKTSAWTTLKRGRLCWLFLTNRLDNQITMLAALLCPVPGVKHVFVFKDQRDLDVNISIMFWNHCYNSSFYCLTWVNYLEAVFRCCISVFLAAFINVNPQGFI